MVSPDEDIFEAALELPAAERAAFLDRACAGDAARRARIAALLAGHAAAAASFLEDSPTTRPPARPEEQPGDVLGRYTLVRKIGDGGCGVVYLAEQREPLRRQVALKVIRLGMDTREVIARFEGERQALAMMDHPDIARVFDAGTTENGRPFFVMEFVDGVPITKFCDDHALDMTARLELFARICGALQHAHQKGIIHRDLKPSNILVTAREGVPAPKIIDFGIAKATHGRLTEHTLLTGFGQLIGTPAYMSPEQAEARETDIDTRSDIYALGVLLYELLSGRPPYDPAELVRAGLHEIRRIIREVEPPRPSTRVSTLTDADRATIARQRNAAPLQLSAVLRGDLDWIVMRCLEKDRARRYDTANELADDVRRHLRQEPVVARPPTTAYRVQRFVARHRLACASAAALALSLIIGTVVSVRQAVRATRAETIARAERDAAQAARADAQRRQEQAEDLLAFMLGDFRAELKKAGRLSLLDTVGEKAMAYFTALDARDLTDTTLARQARALTQIGETRLDQARYPEAAAAFQTAYDRAAALATRHPRNGDMLFERAQAEFWIGFTARRQGDSAAEREWLVRYRDSAAALLALEPGQLRAQREFTSAQHNLAVLELDRGNLQGAAEGFRAEQAAIEGMLAANPGDLQLLSRLADVASWQGTVAERQGNFRGALERFADMSARYADLAAREPKVARWQVELARSATFSGNLQFLQGRGPEATAAYTRAQSLFEALVAQDPKNRQWQLALLNARLSLAAVDLAQPVPAAARDLLADSRVQLEALVAAEPSSRPFIRSLAAAWRFEARFRVTAGAPGADAAAARALELGEPLAMRARADNGDLGDFAQSCLLAGRIALAAGQPDTARRHWQRALDLLSPHVEGTSDWRLLDPAAQALVLTGNAGRARPLIEQLKGFGYQPLDPATASALGLAPSL
jgi:serine/threonine protein kinase